MMTKPAPNRLVLALVLLLFGVSWLPACGDDTPPQDTPDPPAPISVTREIRGIGLFTGDAAIAASVPEGEQLSGFAYLLFRGQLVDELIISRLGSAAVPNARFAAAAKARREEVEAVRSFDRYVMALDLMRVSRGATTGAPEPYLASWDGNDRPIANYGFWHEDLRLAVLDQVRAASEAQQPDILIIGAEMERYLAMPGGIDDYPNFVTLYREAVAEVRAASPKTKVGPGIDWVRFQLDIVPMQTLAPHEIPESVTIDDGVTAIACDALPGDAEARAELELACTGKAFALYVEPLLRHIDPKQAPPTPETADEWVANYVVTADVLGLAAYPAQGDFGDDPNACPEAFFAFLRPWSQSFPVAYYHVGWSSSSAVGAGKQDAWVTTLIARSLGLQVELLAWATLKDYISSDCNKLTNDLGAPSSICFQGLWSDSGSPKDVFETLLTDVVPPAPAEP